jgi:hypothetical protein
LALARKQDDVRLQERIAGALATSGASAAVMRVQRMSGRRPYAIFFAPVAAGPPSSRIRPALCVVITDPEAKRDVPIDRLQDLFGLTESESRLTALRQRLHQRRRPLKLPPTCLMPAEESPAATTPARS